MPYPTSQDSIATGKSDSTSMATDHPGHHNALAAAVNALESELGAGTAPGSPRGQYTDLATRLNALVPQILTGGIEVFGHSYGQGTGLTNISGRATYLLAQGLGTAEINYSVSGSYIMDAVRSQGGWAQAFYKMPRTQFQTAPYLARSSLVILWYGINDISGVYSDATNGRNVLKEAFRAVISRARCAAVFEESHSSVTYGAGWSAGNDGPTFDYYSNGTYRRATTTAGLGTITIAVPSDFPGGTVAIGFACTPLNNGADMSITVDGSSAGTWTVGHMTTLPPVVVQNGSPDQTPFVKRLTGLSAGAHTIVLTVSTIYGSVIDFDWWGIEAGGHVNTAPPLVLLMGQPYPLGYDAYVGSQHTPTNTDVDNFNTDLQSFTTEFDRFVQYVDLTPINTNAIWYVGGGDNIHPNEDGQTVITAQTLKAIAKSGWQSSDAVLGSRNMKIGWLPTAFKDPVKCASTTNVSVASWTPATTIDGVTLALNDRVLLKDQTTLTENGLYVVNGKLQLQRAPDADTTGNLNDGTLVNVNQGTVNRETIWSLVSDDPITIGTTALYWTRTSPPYSPTQASTSASSPGFMNTNAILANMDRIETQVAALGTTALTTQVIRIFPLGILRGGQVASSINFFASAAAATITASWAGIARASDRMTLARSNNSTTSTGTNPLTFTFASAYTAPTDVLIYGFLMYQATTLPNLYGINQPSVNLASTPAINGNSTTAQGTTPPTAGTTVLAAITADTEIPFAYLT